MKYLPSIRSVHTIGSLSALGMASVLLSLAAATACSDTAGAKPDAGKVGADGGATADAANPFVEGKTLRIPVPETGTTFVKLETPEIATVSGDGKDSLAWDLAFTGYDIFTNSGPSGKGKSLAFGPYDAVIFLTDTAPEAPFITPDKSGGAFLYWYKYEGAPSHALWSRFHVFGVKDGDKYWKVQVIGYYGERQGAPVAALYKIRYAEMTAGGAGPTKTVDLLDGTAGGTQGNDATPSECLDLGTGARAMLTPADSASSSAWHLCFRRQNIAVNGGTGGPRNVTAVDLEGDKTPVETVEEVRLRTEASELAKFDGVTYAKLSSATYRADGVVSAFTGLWLLPEDKTKPKPVAWYVVGADGKQKFLLGFDRFEGATAKSPGTVVMAVKQIQ